MPCPVRYRLEIWNGIVDEPHEHGKRYMPKIGSKLRELRRRRNLGVRELAARSGISHSTISLIERDRMSPSIDTLGAVLDALGTTLTGFFSDLQSSLPYSPLFVGRSSRDRKGGYDFLSGNRSRSSQSRTSHVA